MLVVAPIAILSIGIIVSVTISMVGDAIISQTRAATAYTTQDALDRIEKDIRLSSAFLSTFSAVQPGQGKNATPTSMTDTTGFITSSGTTNDTLILHSPATTANPHDSGRALIYYANQPNACSAPNINLNRPLFVRTIYFLRTENNVTTLWRRTIVPTINLNVSPSIDANSVCNEPWQRDSCPIISGNDCKARDERLIDNVSELTLTYYTAYGSPTTNSLLATNVKIFLKTSQSIAGSVVTHSGTLRATRTNEATDAALAAPVVSVLNPTLNNYNNPTKTTFGWSGIPYAAYYALTYTINGITTDTTTTNTQYEITTKPLDVVSISVTAKNDTGESPPGSYSFTTPLWTTANYENGWYCESLNETQYGCPSYTKTTSGIVMVRGLATNPSAVANQTIFTLPINLRPHKAHAFPVWASLNNTTVRGRINIYPDGRVTIVVPTGNVNWVSLSDIRFMSSDSPIAWINATPTTNPNGWVHYGGAFGNTQYLKDSYDRTHLYGIVGSGDVVTDGASVLTTAASYGPSYSSLLPSLMTTNYTSSVLMSTSGSVLTRGVGPAFFAFPVWATLSAMLPSNSSTTPQYALPLSSGWVNYDTVTYWSAAPAQYSKPADYIVTLRGAIKNGTSAYGSTVATLPTNFRPSKQQAFRVVGKNTSNQETNVRLDILPNGEIKLYSNNVSNTLLSLENVSFYAEQ